MPAGQPGIGLAFIERVLTETPDGRCRDWPLPHTARYPRVSYGGRHRQAGQVVLILSGRPRPRRQGMQALHSCDRPSCVAPWHLRWGTQAENIADAHARDRAPAGARHGRARLTVRKVRYIRRSTLSCRVLAARYGVDPCTISNVRRRVTWANTS